ncbi:MAG: hypothetical protein ACK5O3_13540 [Burkholderiales bacterium]|jgi:hypothetical protein
MNTTPSAQDIAAIAVNFRAQLLALADQGSGPWLEALAAASEAFDHSIQASA